MPPDPDQPQSPVPDARVPLRPQSSRFFRKSRSPFALDDARRQGDISQLAFLTMGGRDPAIAFLNTDNAALGGRPLTVATASPEGYALVAAAIRGWPSGAGFK